MIDPRPYVRCPCCGRSWGTWAEAARCARKDEAFAKIEADKRRTRARLERFAEELRRRSRP